MLDAELAQELYGPWHVDGFDIRIDLSGGLRLRANRGGRDLPSFPEKLRRSAAMPWLRLSLKAVAQRRRAFVELLEHAMVERIDLREADLGLLQADPLGTAIAAGLLMRAGPLLGRPLPDDRLLEVRTGDLCLLEPPIRPVHPVELDAESLLHWRKRFGAQGIRQPFRQLTRLHFRAADDPMPRAGATARASGAVIRWDQARAILTRRGWRRVTLHSAERGFRRSRLVAHLELVDPTAGHAPRGCARTGRIYWLPEGEAPRSSASPGLDPREVDPIAYSEAVMDALLIRTAAGTTEGAW